MPGVPTSTACRNCKARKVKCDLDWPTCAGCRRSKKTCPGPSAKIKWMDGSDQTPRLDKGPPKRSKRTSMTEPAVPLSIVQVSSLGTKDGAFYGCFRMADAPRAHPTTTSDRLAAQLIRYLQKDPHRAVLRDLSYLEYIPQRLSQSTALRDCIALFCSGWFNFRRGATEDELGVICSESYGKAIRSVQRALHSSDEQLKCETLAAVTILERYEALFDRAHIRLRRYGLHTQGLHTLMMKRGPPSLEDDLDVHLTVENQPTLMTYEAVKGLDNFFMTSEWQESISAARKKVSAGDKNGHLLEAYDHGFYFQIWGALVHEAKSIYQSQNGHEKTARAAAHYENLTRLWSATLDDFDGIMERAFSLGVVSHKADTSCPGGMAYDFEKMYFCVLITKILCLKMIMSQMVCDVSEFLGHSDATDWEKVVAKLSQEACMLAPYLRRQGPIAAMLHTNPLFMAIKGSKDQSQLDYALDFIVWVNIPRQTLPLDRNELKSVILKTVSAMTGREYQ